MTVNHESAFFAWANRPVICLGRAGVGSGAGRIKSGDRIWRRTVGILATNAQFIFVIPFDRKGTYWEIAHLKQYKLLSKTIFIRPPWYPDPLWETTRQALINDIELPCGRERSNAGLGPFREGLMFTLDDAGRVKEERGYSLADVDDVRKGVHVLMWFRSEQIRRGIKGV